MAVVNGVITNLGREVLAKSIGYIGGFSLSWATQFKIGEGGYVVTPSGNVPKAPDPSLTDLEAAVPGSGLYHFDKALTSTDFTFLSPSIMQIRCKVLPTEANDDGYGNEPKFFEIGIFDNNDKMLAYATYDEQTKSAAKTLLLYVQIQF